MACLVPNCKFWGSGSSFLQLKYAKISILSSFDDTDKCLADKRTLPVAFSVNGEIALFAVKHDGAPTQTLMTNFSYHFKQPLTGLCTPGFRNPMYAGKSLPARPFLLAGENDSTISKNYITCIKI